MHLPDIYICIYMHKLKLACNNNNMCNSLLISLLLHAIISCFASCFYTFWHFYPTFYTCIHVTHVQFSCVHYVTRIKVHTYQRNHIQDCYKILVCLLVSIHHSRKYPTSHWNILLIFLQIVTLPPSASYIHQCSYLWLQDLSKATSYNIAKVINHTD